MLPHDIENLFPLIPDSSSTYAEAQIHSEWVDSVLGLETEATEQRIAGRMNAEGSAHYQNQSRKEEQYWLGLPVRSLLTPYSEIREILTRLPLKPGETVVDLGAGYGRMGFVIGEHYPGVHFVGYEFVRERVEAGQLVLRDRYGQDNLQLYEVDLSDPGFTPIPAAHYFIYDYGSRKAIEKTLQDLRYIARERPITVIGRGRASRDAIEKNHPWLSQIVSPAHYPHYSVYRSAQLSEA